MGTDDATRATGRGGRRRLATTLVAVVLLVIGLAACDTTPVALRGAVVGSSSGSGLTGVAIRLYADDSETVVADTTTGYAGAYELRRSKVPEGTYRVRIGDDLWWPDASTWADAEPVTLTASSPVTIDATLAEAATLSGRVVDDEHTPLAGVVVAALRASDGGVAGITITGADGAFSFPLSDDGGHRVVLIDLSGTWPSIFLGGTVPTVVPTDPGVLALGTIDISTGLVVPPPSEGAVAVSSGVYHVCVLAGHDLACVVSEDGNASLADVPEGEYAAVAAGYYNTCALTTGGAARCWGDDFYGQSSPPDGTFTALAAGAQHACGLRPDGTITCWGDNDWGGQTDAPEGTFKALSAGRYHTCAIATDDALACWGAAFYDVSPAPTGTYASVGAGGFRHACAVTTDGSAHCWGRNEYGQSDAPPGTFTEVAASGDASCGLDGDGVVTCWPAGASPDETILDGRYVDIEGGPSGVCAVTVAGDPVCWGGLPVDPVLPSGVALSGG